MKKFLFMVVLMLGMSATAVYAKKTNVLTFEQRMEMLITDTTIINSINYKTLKFDKYVMNLNSELVRISKYLDLDNNQKAVLFDVNNNLAKEFDRLNRIENFEERKAWFHKVISHTYTILGYTLEPEQFRKFRKLFQMTMINRGYWKNGQFVDIYAEQTKTTEDNII